MLTVLTVLTIIGIAVVILLLVVYLMLIAIALKRADGHLVRLVGGLRAIQGHAEPLPTHLTTINRALMALRDLLRGTERHMAGADRIFEQEAGGSRVL